MLFNSIPFIVFFAVFVPIYFFTKGKIRIIVCLVSSYVFYGWWDWRFLSLILFSTSVDYIVGLQLDSTEDPKTRKRLLIISLATNLGLLGVFKYFNFFLESFYAVAASLGFHPLPVYLNIVLPIGISFYTFQTMSYTIDLYRKQIPAEKSLIKFATFVAFFPQLVAGPIVRASEFLPQLQKDRWFIRDNVSVGISQALWGMFKKVAIADSISPVVTLIFNNPSAYSSVALIFGVVLFSFQIYCDFSGYSDIAIGIARVLGFKFPKNFDYPLFSKSFSEYWTRWHISLSRFLQEYLFFSLALSGRFRGKKWWMLFSLILTMFLGGLWHGAAWTFVIWGLLHGCYLVLQRILGPSYQWGVSTLRIPVSVSNGFLILLVYVLTCITFVFFRSPSIEHAMVYIDGIVNWHGSGLTSIPLKFLSLKGFALICFLLVVEIIHTKTGWTRLILTSLPLQIIAFSVTICAILLIGSFNAPFIYFQF